MSDSSTFLREHSKVDASGNRTVTQGDFFKFASTLHQQPEEAIRAQADMNKDLAGGSIRLTTDDLAAKITKSKENSEDYTGLESSIRISRPDGALDVRVQAMKESVNPQTREKIVHYGAVTVRHRTKSMISTDAAEYAKTTIEKIIGG